VNRRVVPIIDQRLPPGPGDELLRAASGELFDTRGRVLRDLRISVTDRCNFRCQYCMPRAVFDSNYKFLPHAELLNFDEITRLARLFVEHGTEKIRLTGGEPLLRKNIEVLVGDLAALKTTAGRNLPVTLTTNGSLLKKKAAALKAAGLARITVSLDALDEAIFKRMNDADYSVADVLAGLKAATEAGFSPIKVNMVVQRGVNDSQIEPMARFFRGTPHVLRFIEYMDVGESNHWQLGQVVPTREVISRIQAIAQIAPCHANYSGEVAKRWRYLDGKGEIGFITSVTQPFCGDCTRARLSTDGKLYTCLFASQGRDLRAQLRSGASDLALSSAIRGVWEARTDRYSEARSDARPSPQKVEMSYIGG
jgi:cyclic pyranopterin phosphate synthase